VVRKSREEGADETTRIWCGDNPHIGSGRQDDFKRRGEKEGQTGPSASWTTAPARGAISPLDQERVTWRNGALEKNEEGREATSVKQEAN